MQNVGSLSNTQHQQTSLILPQSFGSVTYTSIYTNVEIKWVALEWVAFEPGETIGELPGMLDLNDQLLLSPVSAAAAIPLSPF